MPTNSVTNTLLFYCAGDDDVNSIRQEGIRLESADVDLLDELSEAKRTCDDRILIVDAMRIGPRGVPADAVLNAKPYLPPFPVTAAGGFVTRTGDEGLELLLIRRRGAWDLPKGKLEQGETVEHCAVREVEEELGVDGVQIGRPLGRTIHGYPDGDGYAVKTTWWFEMSTSAATFRPQTEEDIEAVEWAAWDPAQEMLGYESLRHHARRVRPLIGNRNA